MKPHILVTEPEYFTPASLALLRQVGSLEARRLSRAELLRKISEVGALVVRIETQVDRVLLNKAKRLECVATATTGLDHIDAATLQKRKIPLFSLHGEHSVPTAEHALALLLATSRNIPQAHLEMSEGGWKRWLYIGTELYGKTLGIFGIGRIGREVAKRAKSLGLKVLAYDPYLSKAEIALRSAVKVNWQTLLQQSDFITLHAPLTKETLGCFGEAEFHRMKPSLIFVNTARGAIVQEKALLEALAKRKIRAAACDVYPEEPLPVSHALRRYARLNRNLILTPHLGGSTYEAVERASRETAKQVANFFKMYYDKSDRSG